MRISGHIESEDLWKWKNCLVGEMDTVSSIHKRLDARGLGEMKGFSDVSVFQKTSINKKDRESSTKLESSSSSESSSEDSRRLEIEKGHKDKKDMETTPKLNDEHNKDKGINGSDPKQFRVKEKMLRYASVGVEEEDCSDSSEGDVNFCNIERLFFPKFEQKKDSKRRYGSLMRFQDKVISSADRKKRDRAFRCEKKILKEGNDLELSGKSLIDSNLVAHSKILIKRAKETLKLGKSVGIRIDGNKEEAIGDLARFESI
ncbi:hypothetical protein V6N13_064244 [Hibiscus sabdariffa]